MRLRLLSIALCFAAILFADGGSIQFRRQAGSLVITVFGAPSPLRAGASDLSVLVQDTRDTRIVLDADVTLTLSKPGEKEIVVPATRAQATNKLLYAAYPVMPEPGDWTLIVRVKSQDTAASVEGVITVLPQRASIMSYWLYIAFAPAGVFLFLLHQNLKARSRHAFAASRNSNIDRNFHTRSTSPRDKGPSASHSRIF